MATYGRKQNLTYIMVLTQVKLPPLKENYKIVITLDKRSVPKAIFTTVLLPPLIKL